MNSPKAPNPLADLGLPTRLEGLMSLLIASPMTLLGCTPVEPVAETEGSSSGSTGSGPNPNSTGIADTGSTGIVTTGATSGSSGSSDGTTMALTSGGTVDPSTTTDPTSGVTTEMGSSSTGDGMGTTCERAGDVMDMCGYGGYYGGGYEYYCTYVINYYIGLGDVACAQAHNEIYACIAELDCAQVAMGIYNVCNVQYENMYNICYDWGGTFGTDSGWGGTFGSDGGFIGSDGGFVSDGGFIGSDSGWSTTGIVWGTSDGGFGGST